MFPGAKALLVLVPFVLVAQAQSDASTTASAALPTSSISTCVLGCVTTAAAGSGCVSFTNLTCVCSSTAFQQAALTCLQANCTAADQASASQLQSAECAAISTGSGASAAPSSTASSGTSSSASATQSATSKSAAMALTSPFSFGSLVGTLVASAGVLAGAAFVL